MLVTTIYGGKRPSQCIDVGSTDQSIISGGRNSVKVTVGIGELSKDVRAFVSATKLDFSMGEMIHNFWLTEDETSPCQGGKDAPERLAGIIRKMQ